MPIPQNPISRIQTLSNAPTRIDGAFDNWILQVDTPVFLKDNASAEETIIRLRADTERSGTVAAHELCLVKLSPEML